MGAIATYDVVSEDLASGLSTDQLQMVHSQEEPCQWCVLEMQNRSITSLPMRKPRCFPPKALFQRVTGEMVCASELKGSGGDLVIGPGRSIVRVARSKKHKAERRTFTKLETAHSALEVTSDHRVLVRGTDGLEFEMLAGDIKPVHVLTGSGFHLLTRATEEVKIQEVVEIVFQDDAPVLTWMRETRKFHNPKAHCAFAVCGSHPQQAVIKKTFWDLADYQYSESECRRRSASADSSLTKLQLRKLARARGRELAVRRQLQ